MSSADPVDFVVFLDDPMIMSERPQFEHLVRRQLSVGHTVVIKMATSTKPEAVRFSPDSVINELQLNSYREYEVHSERRFSSHSVHFGLNGTRLTPSNGELLLTPDPRDIGAVFQRNKRPQYGPFYS